MASLTGNLVAETYKALLKTIDNDILTASEKQITDGLGGGSNVFIDSQGFLRANKYKVTNGLATQFLKADGSLDANSYLTSITGAQVITALGYTPVTNQRTLTINGVTYNLTANRSWTVEGTAAVWGNITGTLSNQTDLQNALNAKFDDPTGTISQYIRGDGSIANFPSIAGGLPTGGTAGQILSKIDSTDYNAEWIDNYATQTKNEVKLGQTLTKGTPVYVSSANGTNMIVSAASNTSEALSSKTLGLLETGGATNAMVKCVTFGLLAGLDTSTASAGDPVWLGPNGTLIFGLVNKPYAPAHLVYIGVVTRVQSNNGEIFVNVQNGFELKEIHDVYIADPANNHGLFYDIADGLWKNKSIAGALGYTPQAQLSGTGFVKIAGTTISYDNSTYLTTADAVSTYQTLANLSTDLATSATKYPSVNAVIAGLATKQPLDADLTAIAGLAGTAGFLRKTAADTWALVDETYLQTSGGTLTGNLTISSANPKLLLTDTNNNPDYSIQNYDGTFKITDETNSADRFFIYSTGIGYYNGDFKANKLYVEGGLSTQFIKGDGTLDTNTYLTAASLDGYLAKAGGTMTGDLNFYTLKTTRVGGNAYIRGSWQGTYWGIGAAATGHTIIIDQVDFSTGAYESITDVNLMLGTRTVVHSGNVATYALPITGGTVTGSITATSFVKSGGTSTQFLMADGSVTTLSSPVTGSGSAGYIPKWTTAANIGSSLIYDDGTSIGIAYSTPNKGGYGRTLTGASFGSASFGFEAVGGTTTNGGLVGGLSFILSQNDSSRIVGSAIQSNLVGTTATNYGADLRFFAKADAGVISEVARMTSAGLRVYGTIIKDGGTASQYLMADGSVTTAVANTITGSLTSGYIPKATGANTLGNSIIYTDGTKIGINTNTPSSIFEVSAGDTTIATYSFGLDNRVAVGGSFARANRIYNTNYVAGTSFFGILGGASSLNYAYWTVGNPASIDVTGYNTQSGIFLFPSSNVSIGAAIDSGYRLDVNGTGRFTGSLDGNIISANSAGSTQIFLKSSGAGANRQWQIQSNETVAGDLSFMQSTVAGGSTYATKFNIGATGGATFSGSVTTNSTYNITNGLTLFGNHIVTQWYNGNDTVFINYNGYNGGTTQFRNFHIYDGKQSIIATFDGPTKGFRNYGSIMATQSTISSNQSGSDWLSGWDNTSINGHKMYFGYGNSGGTRYGLYITGGNSADFDLTVANKFYVMGTGNVLINTTIDAGYKLDVNGAARSTSLNVTAGANVSGDLTVGGMVYSGSYAGSMLNYIDGTNVPLSTKRFYASQSRTNNDNGAVGLNLANLQPTNGVYSPVISFSSMTSGNVYNCTYAAIWGIKTADEGSWAAGDLVFGTANPYGVNKRMIIKASGNVLINTTTDSGYNLDVSGTGRFSGGITSTGFNLYTGARTFKSYTYGTDLTVNTAGGWAQSHRIYNEAAPTQMWFFGAIGTTAFIRFGNPASIDPTGFNGVGFGLSSGGAGTFDSSLTATAFFESSDFRLKKLIEHNPIVDGIENLQAKLYEKAGKIEIGYFAQDAELIMPYAVTKNEDGFLNLSYREIHTAKIARLEKEVAELKEKLNVA